MRNFFTVVVVPNAVMLFVTLLKSGYFADYSTASIMGWTATITAIAFAVYKITDWIVGRPERGVVRPDTGFGMYDKGSSGLAKLRAALLHWPKEKVFLAFFWAAVIAGKMWWNIKAFGWLKHVLHGYSTIDPLMIGSVAVQTGYIFAGLIAAGFLIFFFLDTFTFFYFGQGLATAIYGGRLGIGKVKTWRAAAQNFERWKLAFMDKMAPSALGLTTRQKELVAAKAWNGVIDRLFAEHRLSMAERERLKFTIEGESDDDFLAGAIVRVPRLDKSAPPVNDQARERIMNFIETMQMEMPQAPVWHEIPPVSVMTPVFEEDIVYPFEVTEDYFPITRVDGDVSAAQKKELLKQAGNVQTLNVPDDTGKTKLAYLVDLYPDEWLNFIEELKTRQGFDSYEIRRDLGSMSAFTGRGVLAGPLHVTTREIKDEITWWAAYRHQELARTVRGVMYQREALKFHARINFPKMSDADIERLVNEKFQYIVGHQPYGEDPYQKPDAAIAQASKSGLEKLFRGEYIRALREKFEDLEITSLEKGNTEKIGRAHV